jgi:flagellar basal-body rod modification protein FlgD
MSTVLNGLNGNASSTSSADAAVAGNGTSTSDTANMFLKLLVAQIRNQDPLDPKDSSEYVNQLNQLSQTQMLESMVSQNRSSASMLEGLQVLAMGAQVGSTVTVTTDRVTLADSAVHGSFALSSAASNTQVELTGADGVSHTINLGSQAAGTVNFTIDPTALGLPPGTYTVAVKAGDQKPVVGVTGTLESVRLSGTSGLLLNVAGVGEVASTAVTAFSKTSSSS